MELFVVWTVGVLVFLSVSIVIFTVAKRAQSNRIDRRMKSLELAIEELLQDPSADGFEDKARDLITRKQFPYFERYLRNTISSTGPLDVSVHRRLADISGFTEHLRRLVKRKRRWKRAHAVRTLSYLREREDISLFRDVLEKERFYPCVYAAALALALCGDTESLREITVKVYRKNNPNRDMLLTVLHPFGKDAAPQINQFLDEEFLPITEACVLVDLLGAYEYRPAKRTLERMLKRTKSLEVKIHVIEALGCVGDEDTCRMIIDRLKDERFRVRLKTVISLGRIAGERYLKEIEEMMNDEDWWARRNAAETLYRMGTAGRERLERIASSGPGPASSSARLVLEEARFGRDRWEHKHVTDAA